MLAISLRFCRGGTIYPVLEEHPNIEKKFRHSINKYIYLPVQCDFGRLDTSYIDDELSFLFQPARKELQCHCKLVCGTSGAKELCPLFLSCEIQTTAIATVPAEGGTDTTISSVGAKLLPRQVFHYRYHPSIQLLDQQLDLCHKIRWEDRFKQL